jgi:hypothetical protein
MREIIAPPYDDPWSSMDVNFYRKYQKTDENTVKNMENAVYASEATGFARRSIPESRR